MSTDFNFLSKDELIDLCRQRDIKTAKSYTKTQLIDLLNGKEITKRYKCDFEGCDYSTNKKDHLEVHKRKHNGEKPYTCDFVECDASFARSGHLTIHKRIHTGEKPYKCDQCDAAFARSHHLINHKRTHTREKPYKCDECDASFARSHHLITHKRTHSGEKPYKCDFDGCDASFARSDHLKTHKNSMHTEEGQRRQKKSEHFTFSYLEKHIEIKREHQVDFSCNGGTFCRLDGLSLHKNKNGKAFIIAHENDEHQHEGYMISCDTRRMTEVRSVFIQDGNDIPLIFIRYNPDAFRIDEELQKIKKKDRLKRYVELVKELENSEEDMMPLTIYYMYYDMIGDKLEIFYDPDYPEELKGNVRIIY